MNGDTKRRTKLALVLTRPPLDKWVLSLTQILAFSANAGVEQIDLEEEALAAQGRRLMATVAKLLPDVVVLDRHLTLDILGYLAKPTSD